MVCQTEYSRSSGPTDKLNTTTIDDKLKIKFELEQYSSECVWKLAPKEDYFEEKLKK